MNVALAQSSNPASRASSIHVYPDTPHVFHADYRSSYRKQEARDGWKRMADRLRKHGL